MEDSMKLRLSLFSLVAGVALAQTPVNNITKIFQPDNNPIKNTGGTLLANPAAASSFQTMYAGNFGAAVNTVKIMNTGTAGGVDGPGTICANVYIFDTAQNMQTCCHCKISPDGLAAVKIDQFLPGGISSYVIKLLATYPGAFQPQGNNAPNPPGACDATQPSTSLDPSNIDAAHPNGIPQGTSFTAPGPPIGTSGQAQQYLAPGMGVWLEKVPYSNPVVTQTEFHQSTLSLGEAATLAFKCSKVLGVPLSGGSAVCPASICSN